MFEPHLQNTNSLETVSVTPFHSCRSVNFGLCLFRTLTCYRIVHYLHIYFSWTLCLSTKSCVFIPKASIPWKHIKVRIFCDGVGKQNCSYRQVILSGVNLCSHLPSLVQKPLLLHHWISTELPFQNGDSGAINLRVSGLHDPMGKYKNVWTSLGLQGVWLSAAWSKFIKWCLVWRKWTERSMSPSLSRT